MSLVPVFSPSRILSSANSADLLNWVRDRVDSNQARLLIDLRNVLFMDSAGLGALIAAYKIAEQANGELMLCSLNGQARMLLEMTGLESVFQIYESVEDFQQKINYSRST
jgi:anti-anti-sigma factor